MSETLSKLPESRLLAGRVAFVTGAGAGIGRGIAQALAGAGAHVAVTGRRRDTCDETARLIAGEGGSAWALEVDVSDFAAVSRAVEATVDRWGGLDILVQNANAGGDSALPIALEDVTEEDWMRQARVAWDGSFHCAQAAFTHLKASGRGRFIVLGSAFGLHGAAMNPVYSALKGGDRGFVKSLAREWGGHGITVNAIQPSAATEPTRVFFAQNPAVHQAYLSMFPLGRMGEPREDIGRAVVALASDLMGYVSGQNLPVDGGLFTAL
ncbi:SDR family NAD(P)-dependent oxidoreductase [Ideonella sp. B508-1]|uniref:SDR family NAD(P)-dependent oxidoreductase n=1 Tax=Ideonella sp. B508-1 TaxID=137716 RepID=UPI00034958D6|nr:SDR family NAD(P)-dependent oxidoreductase [Ideonella sp. B508-1]